MRPGEAPHEALTTTQEAVATGLVIVDYRSWRDTRDAVQSALGSNVPFDWIVIVDNGDAVPEAECRDLAESVQLVRANRNGGFAYGVNLGLRRLKKAGATHAMILNPDARLRPDTLGLLIEAFRADARLAIVGPVVYSDEAETVVEFAGADALWHLGWLRQRKKLRSVEACVTDEPYINGCCWLMNMTLVEEVGELPEGYFLYFEETDYCQSVRRRGYRMGVVPKASAVHLGSRTVGKNSPLFRYQLARNRVWFMRRWSRTDQYVCFLLFTALVKAPLACLLFGLRDRDLPALWAFLRGSLHGVVHPVFSVTATTIE